LINNNTPPNLSDDERDEIIGYCLEWFKSEGDSPSLIKKLIVDLQEIFEVNEQQAKLIAREQYRLYKHYQRQQSKSNNVLQNENDNSEPNSKMETTPNGFEDFDKKIAKRHILLFPNLNSTANLVLSCFFNTRNAALTVKNAYDRFKGISDKSERLFYYHTNELFRKRYLILTSKGNPLLFKLNKEIFNAFAKSSMGIRHPFKPIEKLGETGNGDQTGKKPFAKVGKESSESVTEPKFQKSISQTTKPIGDSPEIGNGGDPGPEPFSNVTRDGSDDYITLNLHNIVAHIPCEIHDVVIQELRAQKHDFILKRENSNLRCWGLDQPFELNGENFTVGILVYRHAIELKFIEMPGTDIVMLVGDLIDRIFHVLNWLKERFVYIKFPVESDFKFYNATGQVYQLEVEFENVATDLLYEYVKSTGNYSEWWIIDADGNKIGFDSSARLGRKRVPKVEIKGPDAISLTNSLMTQFSAMAKGNVNVIKTHQATKRLEKQLTSFENTLNKNSVKTELLDKYNSQLFDVLESKCQTLEHTITSVKKGNTRHIGVTESILNAVYVQEDTLEILTERVNKHDQGFESLVRTIDKISQSFELVEKAYLLYSTKKGGFRQRIKSLFQ
jgi:hypothetical protein